jgi:hypothetical protein
MARLKGFRELIKVFGKGFERVWKGFRRQRGMLI